jgi:hypothetical protein
MEDFPRSDDTVAVPTEARVSLRALLIWMAVASVVAAALGGVLRQVDGRTRFALLAATGIALLILTAAIGIIGWQRRRAERRAGQVLLELVRHSYFMPRWPRAMAIFWGVTLVALSLAAWVTYPYFLMTEAHGPQTPAAFWPGLISVFLNALILVPQLFIVVGLGIAMIWWSGNVRFCEQGIIDRHRFIPWYQIGEPGWDACYQDVLILKWGAFAGGERHARKCHAPRSSGSPSASSGGQIAVRVPGEMRERLKRVLIDKL